MKVLVIPEDFRKDQYLLRPIVTAMLAQLKKPRAKVVILTDPLLGGIDRALNVREIKTVIERYQGMVDLFLLCVDRDGVEGRRAQLDRIEKEVYQILPSGKAFIAENAWQELEVWVLAGLDLPAEWSWQAIRAERDPKETYFKPVAEQRGLLAEPGEGRKTLGEEAARRYDRIRQLCPEDIRALEFHIATYLESPGSL